MEPALSVYRGFWRGLVSPVESSAGASFGVLALSGAMIMGGAGFALAQGISEQQVRCLQLQQELAAAQGGGGANREELARVEQQIAQADRVFQGTRASMEDARCFESFFIFGRGLVRSPKCLNMNDRLEDARRQLTQLQQQRKALTGGGGNKRRQAELQQALARSGCGGAAPQQTRRGGGLFDFFGGGRERVEELPRTPIYRNIDPNGRYRSVCVRLCDGFYYPISYATSGARLAQDAERCQSTCAAPAELYVYRNPGQEIEQAVSLSGSAYMDLPVALRYRSEYVKGCSCKQAEYNPTDIEAANKRAEVDAGGQPAQGTPTVAAPPPLEPAAEAATPQDGQPQFDLDITGTTEPAPPPQAATEPPPPAAIPEAQQPPPLPPAAEAPPPPPPPAPTAAAPPPPPAAVPAEPPPAQPEVIKRRPAPATPPASPFGPQF